MLVESYGLNWTNLTDNYGFNAFNYCQCFIDNDRWDISLVHDHRFRYTELNYSNNILNTELDYCPSDAFLQEKSMIIVEHESTNITQLTSSLSSVNTCQTSINDGRNALECNGNLPSVILPNNCLCFDFLDLTLIDIHSSLTPIPHLTNKSPTHQFTINSRSFKRFLHLIKYRLNTFLAYTTLFILLIILGTIIFHDILKYGFNTGLTRKKRQRLERKQFARSRLFSKTPSYRRPSCLNIPDLATIPEEDENSS